MATPEANVKRRIDRILKERGAYYISPATGGYGRSGVADRVVLYHGHWISIEAKATAKNKPTALQCREARNVALNGGHVLLIHKENVEKVKLLLDIIDLSIKLDRPAPQQILWPGLFIDTDKEA